MYMQGWSYISASTRFRKYEGYLQLTGWDLYNFPKEMDRQDVSVLIPSGACDIRTYEYCVCVRVHVCVCVCVCERV